MSPELKQTADFVLQGLSNAEIAEKTGVKVRTVKARMNQLFKAYKISAGGIQRVKLAAKLFYEKECGISTAVER